MKRLLPRIILLLFALWLAACGGKQEGRSIAQTIEMTEYSYTPSTLNLQVGDVVTLKLVNEGSLEHEIMFGREVVSENGRPNGYETDMFTSAGVEPMVSGGEMSHSHDHEGHMVVVAPGKESTMAFTVTEKMVGEWEMGCFLLSGTHYDSGMQGKVVVTP